MSSPLHNHVEQRMAEMAQRRAELAKIQEELRSARTTVVSKSRLLHVTVDSRGELTDVDFKTNAYRTMAPAELGALIVETVHEAREKAMAMVAERMQPAIPDVPLHEMMKGAVDFEGLVKRLTGIVERTSTP